MFRCEWVILREYVVPSQKLPLIISFLRYTFGAAEACMVHEVLQHSFFLKLQYSIIKK
jgi:hypothetical protein